MISLSFSRWKWADCPYAFNKLYIEKSHKEEPTEPMLIGGEVAEFLKHYRLHCFEAGVGRDMHWFWRQFDATAKSPKGFTNKERTFELLEKFLVSDFAEIPVDAKCVMIEKRLAFDKNLNLIQSTKEDDAWLSKDAAFRMISDATWRVGDTLHIIDEKTGFKDPDPLQLEISSYLLMNAIDALDASGICYVAPSFNILSSGKRIDLPVMRVDELVPIRQKILDRLDLVNSWTEFPATACGQCEYCTVPNCPVRAENEALVLSEPKTPISSIPTSIESLEQAEKALLFISFAGDMVNRVKNLLRAWVEREGPVSAGGQIAELRVNNPWKVTNLQALLSAMIAYGVPKELIFENLSVTESALEKIVKKAGIEDRKPMLLSYGERKEYKPRFGIYNDKL